MQQITKDLFQEVSFLDHLWKDMLQGHPFTYNELSELSLTLKYSKPGIYFNPEIVQTLSFPET
jgi:hypothetical protein